ncbi:MAG: hypothetical protein JSR77_12540 [Planctomycetes bacterium]|nr:hypothetical protein [Planctomycetota bacterium]
MNNSLGSHNHSFEEGAMAATQAFSFMAAVAVGTLGHVWASTLYVLAPSPPPYSDGPYITAITARAETAFGVEFTSIVQARSFRWTPDWGRVPFLDAPNNYYYAAASDAAGARTAGIGLEQIQTGAQRITAVIRDSDGTYTSLGRSDAYRSSRAVDISADGQTVVGDIYQTRPDGNEIGRPFIWTAATGRVDLPHAIDGNPFFLRTHFSAISADGRVAVGDSNEYAFRWTAANGYDFLSTPAGAQGAYLATDVSADGSVIVGKAVTLAGDSVAAYWDGNNVGHILDARWINATALHCSADAAVISGFGVQPGGTTQAWIWTRATGVMAATQFLRDNGINIPTGYMVNSITAISPDGTAFGGSAVTADGQSYFYFIATVPTPSAGGLLLGAAVLYGRRRRRRR